MKKLLLLVLAYGCIAQAEMYYDAITGKFFTYPNIPDINAEEYNQYASNLAKEVHTLIVTKDLSPAYTWRTVTVNAKRSLECVNTPTSQQFLSDLSFIESYYDYGKIFGFIK